MMCSLCVLGLQANVEAFVFVLGAPSFAFTAASFARRHFMMLDESASHGGSAFMVSFGCRASHRVDPSTGYWTVSQIVLHCLFSCMCVDQVELRVRRLLLGLSANEIRSMMIRSASLTASSAALDIQLEMQKQILHVRVLITIFIHLLNYTCCSSRTCVAYQSLPLTYWQSLLTQSVCGYVSKPKLQSILYRRRVLLG